MNQQYVQQAMAMAPHVGNTIGSLGGPVGFVGRVAGFGPNEIDAGIPGWAWFILGAGAGVAVGYLSRPQMERYL